MRQTYLTSGQLYPSTLQGDSIQCKAVLKGRGFKPIILMKSLQFLLTTSICATCIFITLPSHVQAASITFEERKAKVGFPVNKQIIYIPKDKTGENISGFGTVFTKYTTEVDKTEMGFLDNKFTISFDFDNEHFNLHTFNRVVYPGQKFNPTISESPSLISFLSVGAHTATVKLSILSVFHPFVVSPNNPPQPRRSGVIASDTSHFTIRPEPVPEPSTILSSCIALVGLPAFQRKYAKLKKKTKAQV